MTDSRLLPPLAALRAFEAVGRLGGIRRAAKELSIDHAVISRHMRSLETWLGVALLIRHGHGNSLTPDGEVYHERITAALNIITGATDKLMKRDGYYKLRIWCAAGLASLWLSSRLGDFMQANPEIAVHFRPANESPDFRAKDVDCDIRYLRRWEEEFVPKGLHKLEFARPSVFPVASPEYVAKLPPIHSAQDLLSLPLLHEDDDLEWIHWFRLQNIDPGPTLPGARLWHADLTLNAARGGQGIALANHMLIGDEVSSGRLVVIQPQGAPFNPVQFGGYTFIAREEQWNAPAIVRFRRWLQQRATSD